MPRCLCLRLTSLSLSLRRPHVRFLILADVHTDTQNKEKRINHLLDVSFVFPLKLLRPQCSSTVALNTLGSPALTALSPIPPHQQRQKTRTFCGPQHSLLHPHPLLSAVSLITGAALKTLACPYSHTALNGKVKDSTKFQNHNCRADVRGIFLQNALERKLVACGELMFN
ncbi:unnamed protein product [Protopolystoma xenopodis]|uniref:Uncharacterized protein n=1 Tax=Protopolystoma xenopodis TaxID=117903 RepID=A0A448WHM2_9PLAT|nr:unnamed protein product [Protopolystoma xenopodis]